MRFAFLAARASSAASPRRRSRRRRAELTNQPPHLIAANRGLGPPAIAWEQGRGFGGVLEASVRRSARVRRVGGCDVSPRRTVNSRIAAPGAPGCNIYASDNVLSELQCLQRRAHWGSRGVTSPPPGDLGAHQRLSPRAGLVSQGKQARFPAARWEKFSRAQGGGELGQLGVGGKPGKVKPS